MKFMKNISLLVNNHEVCKEMLDGGEGRKKQISIENSGSQFFLNCNHIK